MSSKLTVALRYSALIIFMLATSTYASSQTREQVFSDIQKILNKAKGEKIKSFTGQEKITQQVFTVASVSCNKEGLGKYGSEWVNRYTNIPWNDIFEHYIFSEYSNEDLQLVQIKFKKNFTSEYFTSDKAGDENPSKYDKIELYARTKDKADLENLLQKLYTFKEKKPESPFNAQIRNFTKNQTIDWLKDKFSTQLEGDQYTTQIRIVSLDECRLVVTYTGLVRKYEAVIPTDIKSVNKYGSFEYATKVAAVRTTTRDMLDNGDWSYGLYSALGIRNDDEDLMDNIGTAMKHLAGFCRNKSNYTANMPVASGNSNSNTRTQTPEPVRNNEPVKKVESPVSSSSAYGSAAVPADTYSPQWYLSFTDAKNTVQGITRSKTFPEKSIEERLAKGQYIYDVNYGGKDKPWFITFVKANYTSQQWELKDTRDEIADQINTMWKYNDKFSVTDLKYINNKWLMVAAEGTPYTHQSLYRSDQFPEEKIKEFWDKGYDVSSIAWGNGGWLTVFSKGVEKVQGYYTTRDWKNEKVYSKLKQGYVITHVAKKSSVWYVIYEKAEGIKYEVTQNFTFEYYDPLVKSYWNDNKKLHRMLFIPGQITDDYGYEYK